jgi:hypothetical protein
MAKLVKREEVEFEYGNGNLDQEKTITLQDDNERRVECFDKVKFTYKPSKFISFFYNVFFDDEIRGENRKKVSGYVGEIDSMKSITVGSELFYNTENLSSGDAVKKGIVCNERKYDIRKISNFYKVN